MTSAYKMMIECKEAEDTAKIFREMFESELDELEKAALSLPRGSLATGDSSFKESTISSTKVSVLPNESLDGDSGAFEKENEGKDEECAGDSRNLANLDISRRSKNEESLLEDEKEKRESITSVTSMDNTASESASMCARQEQVKDQIKDLDKDQKNRDMLEIQERHACDEEKSEDALAKRIQEAITTRLELLPQHTAWMTQKQDQNEISFYNAMRSGNTKRALALLASGCVQNLDEPDWNSSGDPPLLMAATSCCLPLLSALLMNGCDPAVRSPRGETALHRVILKGEPDHVLNCVEELLKYGCPTSAKLAGTGSTALHLLSRQLAHIPLKSLRHHFKAAVKTLELMAKAGPINAKDHQGRSALHILASSTVFDNNDKTDIATLIDTLLAAGVDTTLKNDRGETALHESMECGTLNTAMLLIPHTPTGITSRYGETPLHIASRKNHVDMVKKLLEHGEDPSKQDISGNTPLHLASARGFYETVGLLVTSPLAELEKVNIDDLTALQVAAESRFINAMKILLKAGADPSNTKYQVTNLYRYPDVSALIDELTKRRQFTA
ncbi:ankyrin-3-like [Pogonomyrmex barbatus]|uniref:Ankyrin-3-like n=1 Tax=Pogonomyrmex barbatus TaxID=144034 RepID=A0A6I9WIK4_9HYME|nr:ankyrin-3-like [Pogonomyrmex barbatus]XP_011641144.1 ankyrin-3-like [Pogonomyrmex barbatus]